MRIREETCWVGLDLLDGEADTSINAVGKDTGGEGTGHAADGDLVNVGTRVRGFWVGEGNARGTGEALGSLVDVGGCLCG